MEYYIEDSLNALRNTVTVIGGNCGPAYNAVLSTVFSSEGDEPVTLQEAKDWCKIDISDDDSLITSLITGARIMCENYANLSFINRTITAKIKNGLGNFIAPFGPVKAITSATDSDGNAITDFKFDCSYRGNVTVIYTAGYDTLPKNLKTAILNQIAFMEQNRGDLLILERYSNLQSGLSQQSKLILNQVRNG